MPVIIAPPADQSREAADFYVKAAQARTSATCCPDAAAPTTALAASYDPSALASLPGDAVAASFGCGDPLAFANVAAGDTILDLGCGAGIDLLLAAEKAGPTGHVIGVDVSDDMLARAKANIDRAGLADRVSLRQGVIENLPVDDARVDWVISNCVVNLSPDKPKVFSEIVRTLKPGGRILIADLVADELPDWVHAHADLYSACVSGAISERRYIEIAEAAGLVNVEIIARMTYDESLVEGLLTTSLPLALDEIAAALKMDRVDLIAMAARDLAGRITSIKLRAEKPITSAMQS
jgi:arsenite methyltransferase